MAIDPTFTTSDDMRRLEADITFNADAPLTLSASNASGRVDITTDATLPAGTIRVAAIRTDNGTFEEGDHHLTVKVEGNTVSIHPDWQFASGVSGLARRIRDQLQYGFRPEDWNLSRLRLSPELDFHINVLLPANLADGSQVKIRTASGEVDARNFRANASIVTASGDVEARDLTGTVAIHTASGDVEAENILESLEINTASGDVSITGGDAWLAARSASGDVTIRETTLRNSRVTTVSGDVGINAVVNNAANYGIETVSGDISLNATLAGRDAISTLGFGTLSGSSNVGAAWASSKRRAWTAGEGTSGPTINVKTVSGDLSASARFDAAVEARSMPMPSRVTDAGPGDDLGDETFMDFKDEMKAFGKEMKHFGKEMKHMTGPHSMPHTPPTPPHATPPVPPTPPTPHDRDEEQRARDREQRMRDQEQRQRDREQRQRDEDQARVDRERDSDDAGLFTAGPSGVDYQRDTTPVGQEPGAASAQPTEPVTPPTPFTEEAQQTAPQDTAAQDATGSQAARLDPTDPRLRVLEALEKGEIDIEDALAQLDHEPTE
jgi:hypothetical protein